ncbi:FAD-binding oxidoreductase [Nocardioides sp. Soil805]|uniref:FAD-binding oxidoreductase n=1 Tax=Nocardioides sp. Soil805 TaxID=1736416 RepID=UPI0007031A50|nr:FAD-linked oxidase C-terminal domain-containing protein [Nocardioides sp. Soil805]KRF36431.1 FAD-linked oxidase [Nocardioides sp. Soil805]
MAVAPPEVLSEALAALVAALPDAVVVTDPARTEKYRRDRSQDPDAGTPLAVVRAEDAGQVQTAVRWAAEHRVPVVPRGAGTGLSGGASALDGGIVLSLERMTAVEVDTDCQVAVVEPGALNQAVKAAAAAEGLWYPPDPASYEICSIGGNIATNAGGLCCVKYGVTTDYVLGLDVVLADGTLVTLGGPRIKDVAGLPLLKLFVGSEGTLGIVTRAILRLEPAQVVGATMVAAFPTMTSAAQAVVAIRGRLRPSMLELMDQPSIRAVESFRPMGLDTDAGALLVAQSDAPGTACAAEVDAMRVACEAAGASDVFVTDDAEEGELFVRARRTVVPAVEPLGELMLEDVGVPVPRLPELVDAVAGIAARHDLLIPVVAHAGDGNTHPLIIVPRGDDDARLRALAAFDEIMDAAIALGGTITGEHGVGRTKKQALPAQLGDDVMALTRRVKDALDPSGILNPGAIL